MSEFLVYMTLVIFASGCIGFILGLLSTQTKHKRQIDEAYFQGRGEAEKYRVRLKQDLRGELDNVRESILETLSAYERTVERVERRLAEPLDPPDETLRIAGRSPDVPRIDHSAVRSIDAPARNGDRLRSSASAETERPPGSSAMGSPAVGSSAVDSTEPAAGATPSASRDTGSASVLASGVLMPEDRTGDAFSTSRPGADMPSEQPTREMTPQELQDLERDSREASEPVATGARSGDGLEIEREIVTSESPAGEDEEDRVVNGKVFHDRSSGPIVLK